MNDYRHTQKALWIPGLVLVVGLIPVGISFLTLSKVPMMVMVIVPILLLVGWTFHSLTIEITGDELHWWFGPGWIRKKVRVAEIASATPVRTCFLEGWGIHYSRFGWLYNVSGFDAVAITLRNGSRFCLGTDEPGVLAARLTARPSVNPPPAHQPGPS